MAGVVIAYVDNELIGLVTPERPGLSLAPREHVARLFDVPGRSAALLASLRLLVGEVKSTYGVDEARIEPTTDLPGAAGHVCFNVVPVLAGEVEVPSDVPTRVAALAEALRRPAAGRPQ